MKRTKVCVDELPKCCRKCVFCYDNRPYWKSTDCLFLNKELDEDEIETNRDKDCQLIDIKTHDRELVKEVCEKIIKFINELAWKDIQYDAFQSTIGEFSGSTSAIPRYAKKYFDLWKYMFGEDLNKKEFEK